MFRLKTHTSVVLLTGALLALTSLLASADDKKADKSKPALSGSWTRKEAELRIEFSDKEVLKISPHGKDEMILIECKYTVDKEGRVKAEITELTGTAKDKVKEVAPVGLKFSFTWKVKDDAAVLSEVKGDNAEALKTHLEGDYAEKK